jgi:hypothetical protein
VRSVALCGALLAVACGDGALLLYVFVLFRSLDMFFFQT